MKQPINYIYYGTFFVGITFLYIFNLFLSDHFSPYFPLFLLLTIGQAALEIGIIAFIGMWIAKWGGKKAELTYVGCTVFIFVIHLIDVVLLRTMDLTFRETLHQIMHESMDNLFELLLASNIPASSWFVAAAILLLIPAFSIFFYMITQKWAQKKPLFMEGKKLVQSFVFLGLALFLWDYSISFYTRSEIYYHLERYLVWNGVLNKPRQLIISSLYSLQDRHYHHIKEVDTHKLSAKHKPNIYLFVIESLREDFITKEIAPNLTSFKNDYIHFPTAISSANGTQISWFSIFYADYPYLWTEYKEKWPWGSPALYALKKLGYKTHLYASSGLRYFSMDTLLFGSNHELIDQFHNLFRTYPEKAYQTDQKTLTVFEKEFKGKEGNLFIFFWDATHFDYSWPKQETKFSPIASELDYFRPVHKELNLTLLKNNYKNAISFLDKLFGSFKDFLQKKGAWEDSIIVVCADHGEEFSEHGKLFHASHLVKEQTHIPLYFKFPENKKAYPQKVASHMDIFPSIFDYLGSPDLFAGQSIFKKRRWPFVFCSRYNGGKAPYEFFIHDGSKKLLGRFVNREKILQSKAIEVVQITDDKDKMMKPTQPSLFHHFAKALQKLFSDIYTKKKEAG